MLNYATIVRRIERLGSSFLQVNPYLLWGLLVSFVVVKNGFRSSELGVTTNFIPALEVMPEASSPFQSGPGPFFLGWLLGVTNSQTWILMTSAVLLLALVLIVPLVKRQPATQTQLQLVLLAALPVLSTQISWLGMYDAFLFLGILVWFFSRSKLMWIIGALVAASANPEQLFVAAVCALIVSSTQAFTEYRIRSFILLCSAILVWLFAQIWFVMSSNAESRAGQLGELFDPSVYAFSKFWPHYVWAIYGALWLTVLLVLFSQKSRIQITVITVGAVVIPLIFAAITLDGPRVLALVTLPLALFFIQAVSIHVVSRLSSARVIAVVTVLLIVVAPMAESGWPAIGPIIVEQLPWFPTKT